MIRTTVPNAHDHEEAAAVLAKLGHRNADDDLLDLAVHLLDIGFAAGAKNVRDELEGLGFADAVECIDENGFA